jgi:hypothetical protein
MHSIRVIINNSDSSNVYSELSELFSRILNSSNTPKEKQNKQHHNCDCCNPPTPERHWKNYNNKRGTDFENEETQKLIRKLPQVTLAEFHQSKMPIIDFGVSTGEQHAEVVNKGRTVIGYDSSPAAIAGMLRNGIQVRSFDLSKLNNKKLSYRESLKEDLACPSDIFLVHILEYLPPEVAICLIYSLMKHAKPGSTFFIQAFCSSGPVDNIVDFVTLKRDCFYASFFGARTDMKILHHKSKQNENYNNLLSEQLIIRKMK